MRNELLKKIIDEQPERIETVLRRLTPNAFSTLGREFIDRMDQAYLTGHDVEPINQTSEGRTSYRLWSEKPKISYSDGHPNWNPATGLMETVVPSKKRDDTESYLIFEFDLDRQTKPEIVKTRHSSHCKEARIYKVK